MSSRVDLTRWNRAGLSRFRYVGGNAATYLEELRNALSVGFPHWEDIQQMIQDDEKGMRNGYPLLVQYHAKRRDLGWEIARALARACHVLTEHLDTYANEGYLGTASQWGNLRRLVEMLGYHPAPPASASTPLVITAKGNAGTLESGFQVQHSPPDGGAPLVFETLEALEVDPAVNVLRPAGWNRSTESFGRAVAPPDRPVGGRPAIAIQGVGEAYARLLDDYKRIHTGDSAAAFSIADFWNLEPTEVGQSIPRVRLWEFKSKAEQVLTFPWFEDLQAALLDGALPEVAAMSAAAFGDASGLAKGKMEQMQRALRRIQIALDEPYFADLRLRDLIGEALLTLHSPWVAPEDSGISAGQIGVMVRDRQDPEAAAVLVSEVNRADSTIAFEDPPLQPDWRSWTKGETSLLIKPDFIERPRLNGPGTVSFEGAHDLAVGEVAAWKGEAGQWFFSTVAEVDARSVRLDGGNEPAAATQVFRALEISRGENGLLFPFNYQAAARPPGFIALEDDDSTVETNSAAPVPGAKYRHLKPEYDHVMSIYLVPKDSQAVAEVSPQLHGVYTFDGEPGKLTSGQWVVADDGARLWPSKIARITEAEDHFTIVLGHPSTASPPLADYPVVRIQGIGPRFFDALTALGVEKIGDLAKPEVLDLDIAISPVRLWEFVTKARVCISFPGDPSILNPVVDRTLAEICDAPVEELAKGISQPQAIVTELKEELRWIEACIDETIFRTLTLGDLLPQPGDPGANDAAQLPETVVRLYGDFRYTLRPEGHKNNTSPLTGSHVFLDASVLPRVLSRGRSLLVEKIEGRGRGSGAFEARILAVYPQARTIDIDPPIPSGSGFTEGNTVLSGNVVFAGHGEVRPEKVLGSGDATRSGQEFLLKVDEISFVADPTQPSGVRAAINVTVEDRSWQQVADLRDSGPADHHYTVRVTEDGFLRVVFGDGRRGRRLPTGVNNIRVNFRVGTGPAGNLKAGSLSKPARPHRRVESVRQPLASTGGNDMESVESLRENAPASLLALERAVSLADFGSLAARHASIWQARAFAQPTGPGRHESIEVVVVPAEGGALGSLAETLRGYIASHALPGVEVQVSEALMTPVSLSVTARIKSAEYEPEGVLEEVREALLDNFSLRRRRLGHDLFLSEIYGVVENVKGVENSWCLLDGSARLRRREAGEREVLFLHRSDSDLHLKFEEFVP